MKTEDYPEDVKRIIDERDESVKELEAWCLAFGTENLDKAINRTLEAEKERDSALKACAELKNALRCADNSFWGRPDGQKVIDRALSINCGKDYFSKEQVMPFPKTICLCGSTRFTDEMLVKQWELTKAGFIVLSWCAVPQSYFAGPHVGDAEGVKEIVDEVHKRKIDIAASILVINVGGYFGDSTTSEIVYAMQHHKPVDWLEKPKQSELDRLSALAHAKAIGLKEEKP